VASEHTGYLNLLNRRFKDDDEGLRAAAGQIQALIQSPGWLVLKGILDDVHSDYFKTLILGHTRGQVPSQAEFARATGFLSGVSQSQIAAEAFAIALQAMTERNQTSD
jgi:hypothetical protein